MVSESIAKILKKSVLISYFLLISLNNYAGFIDDQLVYSRVKNAYEATYDHITAKLNQMNLKVNDFELLLKAYKYEEKMVLYVRNKSEDKWKAYDTLAFCASSGTLGPKVYEGDMQIPEGYYHINHFNPYSNFLLSLGVSYPNKADYRKRPNKHKGGAIYVHGGCATIGCIPLTDEVIQELYILAALAKNYGQTTIGIHIFPFVLSPINVNYAAQKIPEHADFWNNLRQVESVFDSLKVQRKVLVDDAGDYYLAD